MRVKVLFLGPAKDWAKAEGASLEVGERATVADLRDLLSERYPGLKPAIDSIQFAVNETFSGRRDETVLHGGDEVALIPPVSGG